MKVVPQASNCREIEAGGRIYRRPKGGLFDIPDQVARYVIKNEGGQLPALSGITRHGQGYVCQQCGFGCWFTICSRCGGTAVREAAHA